MSDLVRRFIDLFRRNGRDGYRATLEEEVRHEFDRIEQMVVNGQFDPVKYQLILAEAKKRSGIKQQPTSQENDSQVRGILFGDNNVLKYFDLKTKKRYSLLKNDVDIYALCVDGQEVFFGGQDNKVSSLFSDQEIMAGYWVNGIVKHSGRILSGGKSLMSDETVVIDSETLAEKYQVISSIMGNEDKMFGIVQMETGHK